MSNIPTMLTLKETASRTGLTYNFLRMLCLQDKIIYVKAGNRFLINLEKLCEYLNGEGESKGA